jgi:hypothetical protein
MLVRQAAQLCVPDCSVAFTERSRHLYRQRLEPAAPMGTLFAQHGFGIQRRRACSLVSKTQTHQPQSLEHHHEGPPEQGLE